MVAPTRADFFTIEKAKVVYYSDFLTNFDKNPLTGNLAKVTNEESIRQSLRSLVLTQRTERFMQPWIGSKVNGLLFEPAGPLTDIALVEEIKTTISNCEPRVKVAEVRINDGQANDDNVVNITVVFTINNVPTETFSLDLMLNRWR